ncbi:DMT family transporter [Vibrio rumoiensis]|uniref:DMT family transporter n=1 Tax=Vibrio rumoiensis TaxID=76258 RepID=A0ABW7IRL9_9VIBR
MKQYLPILSAMVTILMWSSLASLTVGINHIPASLSVGIVLLIAMLPGIKYYRNWKLPINVWLTAIIGMFGYHFLLFDAFSRAPAVEVNMIQYLWPLFIVIGSPLFGGDKLNPGHIIGAIMAFSGVVLVMSSNLEEHNSAYWFGYLEAFAAALLWAGYTLSNRKHKNMPSSAIAVVCGISGILSLCVFGLTYVEVPQISYLDLLFICLLGLGPMGLSFYTWDYAMRNSDPRFIGSLTYLTPLLSTVMLTIFYNKSELTFEHLMSLTLIIAGSFLGKLFMMLQKNHQIKTT